MSNSTVDKWISNLRKKAINNASVGMNYAEELESQLKQYPKAGISKIYEFYETALDEAHTNTEISRGYEEALTEGPNEGIPWAIYNAVGSVYPEFNREMKDLALGEIFEILDRVRYDRVQENHTSGIREPLLLSDISIARPHYWTGLDEGREMVKKYQNFEELRKNLIDNEGLFFHPGLKEDGRQLFKGWTPEKKLGGVNSDFVVAFSLLRSDICDYGKDYIRIADPNFLNRTMQGIIGMRFSNAETKEDIKVGKTRLKKLLPDPLHGRIDYLRKMAEWVDPKKF